MNLRATFDLVASDGAVAATRIAQETGLSKPTVSEVLRQLLELGLIKKVGRTTGQIGPSAQLYGVDQRAGWVLAVDVGQLWIRAVAADLSGQVIAKADERTKSQRARLMIGQIDALAAQVATEAGSSKPYMAVMGTPGVIRPGEGHLALARLLGWERPEVLKELRERLAVPVVFENDVNLAAIGELSRGAGRGVDDFVLISVGSGVGMAVVLNGSLYRGASGLAGEIGYLPIGAVTPTGRGSARWHEGAFERSVSSGAIVELAKAAGLGPIASAAAVIDEARQGNEAALGVVSTIAERLAYGVAAVCAVLDPELVVLGGGIGTGAGQLLVDPLRRVLGTISPLRPRMAISDLGSGAVLIGAVSEGVRLVKEQLFGGSGDGPGVIATGSLTLPASFGVLPAAAGDALAGPDGDQPEPLSREETKA
jgi:predicted NBD/HSP70 family sugar kinase